ncbi:hypothetical protein DICA4_B03928 [Diutina catenulata]
MPKEHIYVDEACRGNGRFDVPMAGVGVYYGIGDRRSFFAPITFYDSVYKNRPTNQRAELWACLAAMESIESDITSGDCKRPAMIHTDSMYVHDVMTEWTFKWANNGYINARGFPVANQDIIRRMVESEEHINSYYNYRSWDDLQFQHEPGHSGIEGNEAADKLANLGATSMEDAVVYNRGNKKQFGWFDRDYDYFYHATCEEA